MGSLNSLLPIAAAVAAPFTGGTSLAWLPGALGAAGTVDNMIDPNRPQQSGLGQLAGAAAGGLAQNAAGKMNIGQAQALMTAALDQIQGRTNTAIGNFQQLARGYTDPSTQAGIRASTVDPSAFSGVTPQEVTSLFGASGPGSMPTSTNGPSSYYADALKMLGGMNAQPQPSYAFNQPAPAAAPHAWLGATMRLPGGGGEMRNTNVDGGVSGFPTGRPRDFTGGYGGNRFQQVYA